MSYKYQGFFKRGGSLPIERKGNLYFPVTPPVEYFLIDIFSVSNAINPDFIFDNLEYDTEIPDYHFPVTF
jgi:hypothetical protein